MADNHTVVEVKDSSGNPCYTECTNRDILGRKIDTTYLAKTDASSTYVEKSSLNTINGVSMQTGSDISISGTMTSGSIAIDTTTNSDFCQFAYNHPNAIWSYHTATSTPNLINHNYPALVYAEKVWVSVIKAYTYNARVFYFDPDTKAYTEITSGTLNYSIAS